jgi:ABC-type sugar transport system ATPase subunit
MEGRIVQIGRPQDIFARPASAIVAGFIGSPPMNLLPAEIVRARCASPARTCGSTARSAPTVR